MSHRALCLAVASTALLVSASAGSAGELLRVNYDDLTPLYSYGYAYNGGTFVQTVPSGVGVGGSNALQISASGPGGPVPFWGFGGGSGVIPPRTPIGANVAFDQFTYSFDVLLTGFENAVTSTGINITLALTAPDGTVDAQNGEGDKIADIELDTARYDVTLGGFQTISGTFAGARYGQAAQAALLPVYFAAINQVQLNVNMNGGVDFGVGVGPYIAIIDNMLITQLSAGPNIVIGDFNFDGLLDAGDIDNFVEALLESEPFDTFIDTYGADYSAQYGGTLTPELVIAFGDFDDNGVFDAGDIDGFVDAVLNSGRPGTAAIPEPAALGLILPAMVLGLRRRR